MPIPTANSSGTPALFVRITRDRTPRSNTLGDLGMTSESNPTVSLNEFTY
jgi:CRP/FNR family nitrogen fixation transcriptional regulator